ncbi:MAG: hypothetical protein ACX98W_12510, partial [bacterium]
MTCSSRHPEGRHPLRNARHRTRGRRGRIGGSAIVLCLLGAMLGVASGCATARSERAPEPEWVARGGASLAHPASRFVTGFARTRGGEE